MIHDRHFTVEEANAALERLAPMLTALREAKSGLLDEEAREALTEAAPSNGGGAAGRQVGESFLEVRRILLELTAEGIVVRDVDRGLIDFPAVRDGREIYLCWQLGEDGVHYWHDLESGYGSREPLD